MLSNKETNRPSFLEGVSRIVDIGGLLNYRYYKLLEQENDTQAILSDWLQIGEDIFHAVQVFKEEHVGSSLDV